MIEQIAYIEKDGGAVIVRCYGEGRSGDLPARIGDLPVIGLADHCFAPQQSGRIPAWQLKWWKDTQQVYPEMCAEGIEEIALPETLVEIGNYAFYGCDQLKRLYVPAHFARLGSGVFVAANHLETIYFATEEGQLNPPCMKEVLSELTYEIEAVLTDEQGQERMRLTYPEYYEDSIENTPARIIEMRFEGTGFRYRQCFEKRTLDLGRYDDLFYTASVQEYPPTVRRLVRNRLMTPVLLKEEAKQEYIAYLQKEGRAVADEVIRDGMTDVLDMLIREHYFTPELLKIWTDRAAEADQPYMTGRLLELERTMRPARQRYEL